MAWTGTPVVKAVSESLVRVTGVSLAPGASGTISLFTGLGDIKCPDDFAPTKYVANKQVVSRQDSIEISHLPSVPITIVKSGGSTEANWLATFTNDLYKVADCLPAQSAMFYGLTQGEGGVDPSDYAVPVAPGAAVPFPRVGPQTGGGIVPFSATEFVLPSTGIYRVSWAVGCSAGDSSGTQLQVALNGTGIDNTSTLSNDNNQQNTNTVLIDGFAGKKLSIVNVGGAPLIVNEGSDEGLPHAQAPSLTIELLTDACPEPAATPELEIYLRHH